MPTYKQKERRDKRLEDKNKKIRELEKKVNYDGLTGLLRREKFDELLEKLLERSNRIHAPLSYILIDIDNFKKINDTYGHKKGDEVLKKVSKAISHTVRGSDFSRKATGRYGGEEIVVALPNTDQYGARIVGNRINKAVKEEFRNEDIKVTVSSGLASYSPNRKDKNYDAIREKLSKEADKNLYKAKERGKDKVV